ncbi:cell adhesion molecule Dscam2-like isoform X1 [Cloeon dipterum]|uniref:cell adhesion molecule Dscam2-like isoform X1 n=1 Tax=Cloeon dipterum TaxID=197152 RepID=UPI0032207D73
MMSCFALLIASAMITLTTRGVSGNVLEGQGPVIVLEPPARLEFTNSTGTRLDCSAQGSPAVSVTWTASVGLNSPSGGGGNAQPGPVPNVPGLRHQLLNGSLLFLPFPASAYRPDVHASAYRCVATNSVGRVLGREVRLKAVVLQQYELRVKGAVVSRGNTAVLRCQVPSAVRDYLTVTSWLQDDTFNIYPSSDGDGKFHMLPSGELLVLNVDSSDVYSTYHCRATHRLSDETLVSVLPGKITVTEAPRGVVPPRAFERTVNLEVRRDELVILPCIVDSNPQPEYRWYLLSDSTGQMQPLHDSEHRYRVNGLLVLQRARPADSGRYICVANNTGGSERVEFGLVVTAPLGAHVTPSHATVDLGRNAEFSCATLGHPVRSVVWAKDGNLLRDGHRVRFLSRERLQVINVQREDQGMYQCFVKNDLDMAQATAELRLGDTPPQLMYKFIQQTIQPGPSVSLKCIAAGNPTPSIKWTLDGFPLPQNERFLIGQYAPHGDVISHVNISAVSVEDGGTYECIAVNRVGDARHRAQLNVYGLPHVRSMPEISAVAGETLYLSCPVAGYPIETIKWYRGDRLLPVNSRHVVFPNGTLEIKNLQANQDGGAYTCSAANRQGNVASGMAHINVMVPPKLNPFSFRADLHLGERVGLQCMVSKGDPPLEVSWLKDGRPLVGSDELVIRHLDEFTSSLAIGALAPRHSGNYTCVARNLVAAAAHSAGLSVNGTCPRAATHVPAFVLVFAVPPAITPFTFGELSQGERVKVTCSVKRGDMPLTISWIKDRRPIVEHADKNVDVRDTADDSYSSILAISSVSSRHSGNYTCVARNPAKETTYTAELVVTVPPSWVVEPQNYDAKLGQNVVLDCQVEGFPKPTVSWKKALGYKPGEYSDLRPVEGASHGPVLPVQGGSMQILINGSLMIESVKQEDEGRYLCEANNGIGIGLSAVISLTVNAPVQFKIRSKKELVRRGSTAKLVCKALGDNPITVKWQKENSHLDVHSISIKNSSLSQENGLVSELLIYDTKRSDSGVYTCFASNDFGHDQMAIHLLVQDAPAKPTNLRMLEYDSRKVTFEWSQEQDGNSPITRYVVSYRALHGVSSQVNQQVVDGSQLSTTISNLLPDTSYSIQVAAENQLGVGEPSDELQVRTTDEPPSHSPQDLQVDAKSSTQLHVTWNSPPVDTWNGQLLGYYVGHRQMLSNDRSGTNQYNFTTVPWPGNGKAELKMGNLKKFTKYCIVVQAFNMKGAGPVSTEVVAQTLEDVPEASPRDLHCSASTSESIDVSWQPPPEDKVHGVIQGYRLYYEAVEDYSVDLYQIDSSAQSKMTKSLTTMLHGLLKYTNYSIQVLSFTHVGEGVRSSKIFCRTKEDVPGPPAEVKLLATSQDTALVTWQPPKQPNGEIQKYYIYVRVMDSNGRKVEPKVVPATNFDYEIRDLRKRHRYEVWVAALTKVGEGPGTPVSSFTPTNKVAAAVASFGGNIVVASRKDVRLPCRAVGQPEPHRQWLANGRPLNLQHSASEQRSTPLQISSDGTLLMASVLRSDGGDYTCVVSNEHGKDLITYRLSVQVPPATPLLHSTGSTSASIQLQWKVGDDGGSPVKGFVLHYKPDEGEWSEHRVDRQHSTFTLSGLRCGTQYHVYLVAYNRLGSSPSSVVLKERTRGSKPLPPPLGSADAFLVLNATKIGLRLDAWPDGGCAIVFFVVEYMPVSSASGEWLVASNNVQPQRLFFISGLNPGTKYRLRVIAHNAAGSTTANLIATTTAANGFHDLSATIKSSDAEHNQNDPAVQRPPLHKDVKVVAPLAVSTVAVLLSLLSVCFCLRKKGAASSAATQQNNSNSACESKNNSSQREQYYATVRKPPPSPAPDFATLECIPEYSEDIYPYATFHVPPPPAPAHEEAMSTKLQTFVYRGIGAELMQGASFRHLPSPPRAKPQTAFEIAHNLKMQGKSERQKRSRCKLKTDRRESEEYDSFNSESDTEQGTSSRTESSNQLDDNLHPALNADLLYPGGLESSTSTEPSPIAERRLKSMGIIPKVNNKSSRMGMVHGMRQSTTSFMTPKVDAAGKVRPKPLKADDESGKGKFGVGSPNKQRGGQLSVISSKNADYSIRV